MYKSLLCIRYLRTRYIALASIISVMLGVATMIVVNSVMAGFSTEMRDRIHGILADVVIETNSMEGQPDGQRHLRIVEQAAGEYIAGMTTTVEVYGMLTFEFAGQYVTQPVTLIGIDPKGKAQVGPLVDYLTSYNPEMDGKKVIRPALRSRNEPPGWELTAEATEHRRQWVERQQWIQQQMREADPPIDEPAFNQGDPEADNGDESAAGDLTENPFAGGAMITEAPDDLFDQSEEVDPAALQAARLYVGIGRISFLNYDDETGKLKTRWMKRPGDDVKISTVTAGRVPEAIHFNATIVDVFKSGMSEYDSNFVFCNIDVLQEMRVMFDPDTGVRSITSVQIKLKNFEDADIVVEKLRAAFPPGLYRVRTWEEKQGPLLAAVEVESAILNVLLFLIIAVAGFGILAIFYMIVVEKTRDIGILKALGASSQGVMSIFLSYGLALGIVGSGVGVILGLLFVRYINVIEGWITWMTGRKIFDEKIYYFPEIPTTVHPMMVFWVAAGAMSIAVLASILPARRASKLHPVEALRFE